MRVLRQPGSGVVDEPGELVLTGRRPLPDPPFPLEIGPDGACWFAAEGIGADARAHRRLLAAVLAPVGFVNYPVRLSERLWGPMCSLAA